jgi:predicted ATP-binding protein involved in virulence
MLTSIKIEKLFDIFDYDIVFKEEGITILTGLNGYGKTTVLRILDALAAQDKSFFKRLLFKKISLKLFDGNKVTLEKLSNDEVSLSINKLVDIQWEDEFIEVPSVYFIREQRLLRPVPENNNVAKRISSIKPLAIRSLSEPMPERKRTLAERKQYLKEFDQGFIKSIEENAKQLSVIIKETLAQSSEINQKLDVSFPSRLFEQQQIISEEEFTQRFGKVKDIQKLLNEFGLSAVKEDNHPTYKAANATALCVYINDTEQKLAVFSELLAKLRIFTSTLNERRLTFKRITISKEDGFTFTTDQGKPLALSDLSSGEQQEVILLYELLFKVKPGTLVLIDEPELSLHVVWQKQFLDDLFKIIELQKINIVIATHSPQIINNHWDLTVDLEEISQCEKV